MIDERNTYTTVVLLIDDITGRGHAIADLMVRTDPNALVHYANGNAFIEHPRIRTVSIDIMNPEEIARTFETVQADFVFIAYADTLAIGTADRLRRLKIPCIGPSRAAAQLEASKAVAKDFCIRHNLPTPVHRRFTNIAAAIDFCRVSGRDWVVKVNGFTSRSDGAIVCQDVSKTLEAIDEAAAICVRDGLPFDILLEERLTGYEVSAFAFVEADQIMQFPSALDFKKAMDGDLGKNCDGMGTICPHPLFAEAEQRAVLRPLLQTVAKGLKLDGWFYNGFIYLGIMMTETGPQILEINVRFGDPEAEAVLPGIQDRFTEVCWKAIRSEPLPTHAHHDGLHRCSIALTQGALPGAGADRPGWPFGCAELGQDVHGILNFPKNGLLFLAKMRRNRKGDPVTDGGRVAHVVGVGHTLRAASSNAYDLVEHVTFNGKRFRHDIGRTSHRCTSSNRCISCFGSCNHGP